MSGVKGGGGNGGWCKGCMVLKFFVLTVGWCNSCLVQKAFGVDAAGAGVCK